MGTTWVAFVSVATALVPTWHGAATGTAGSLLSSTGAEGTTMKYTCVGAVLSPHGHSEWRALHMLFFDTDPHGVQTRLLGGIGNKVCPILVILDHCSDWTVFLILRDNSNTNVVSASSHVLSCGILTEHGERSCLFLSGSVEIFSLKNTFGGINFFGINGPINFIATALACFLLRREVDLIVHSRTDTVLNFVELPEPFYHHTLGDEDLQVRATGQQVLSELHSSPHICQQLFQLCLLQVQRVLLLDPYVVQLLQQLVPVLLDGLDVALREGADVSGHSLHPLLECTAEIFDLNQCFLQGLHVGLSAFENFPYRVPMLVNDVAGEVTRMLSVLPHHTVPAHRTVAALTEQTQFLGGVSRTWDRLPNPAVAFQVFEVHHGVVSGFLLPPMSLAAEVAEIGFAGLTPLLHFPVAAQVTHQALAFPTQALQHHIVHGQVVYGQSLHSTLGQVHLSITYRTEDANLRLHAAWLEFLEHGPFRARV